LEKIKENNIFSKSTEGNTKNNQLGEVTVGNHKSIIKEWDVKDAPCRVVRDSGM
jgi:hypothetical protein